MDKTLSLSEYRRKRLKEEKEYEDNYIDNSDYDEETLTSGSETIEDTEIEESDSDSEESVSEDDDDGKDFIRDPNVKECVFELGYNYRCDPN